MEFLSWHYSEGVRYYINKWLSTFDWVNHYFSLALLLRSLFAPWKKLELEDKSPGFNFSKKFQEFTFNLISRGIGAAVRFILVWIGVIFIIFSFLGGIAGLFFWILIPVFGLPVYSLYRRQPQNYINDLLYFIKSQNKPFLNVILSSEAGKFVLQHTGVDAKTLIDNVETKKLDISKLEAKSFSDLIDFLIQNKVWSTDLFRKLGIKSDDLLMAAKWWDKKRFDETRLGGKGFTGPGIALDLIYGYTPTLSQYSINMSTPQSFEKHLIGRENVVSRMERILSAGNSLVLVGEPGVGKKTVVYEFANRAAKGEFGPQMAFRKVYEFDFNFILSGSKDLNSKKATLKTVLEEAASAGNIILMVRDIQKLTNPNVEGYDFTEIFEELLERRDLKIIAVSTPAEYERFIAPNLRLGKYLEKVEVTPPTKEEALIILLEAAMHWEEVEDITIRVNALRKILDESDRYITETPFPEKALELLDAVVSYIDQKGAKEVTIEETNQVLAEKTGISFASLTQEENKKLGELEKTIHKRLINQDSAVNLIAKSLRARTVGVAKDKKPIGSFLFLGPTGVGKTETAKVLARVYYGNEEKMLRFDMAEYAGREGFERLIGSVQQNRPGALTTAIKNNPASLLLFDEIEKATPEVFNLFLTLLDEGYIMDAFGKKIGCQHLFVIGTSNAGAEYIRQLVTKGDKGETMQRKVVDYVLEKGLFSPEFINRFDGVVVYEPLTQENLIKIGLLMLEDLKNNLKTKGIKLKINEDAAKKLAIDGYDPAFGARPMRRIVNLNLGDLIGKKIIQNVIKDGDTITILPGQEKEDFIVKKLNSD